jgi:hypothetical protein
MRQGLYVLVGLSMLVGGACAAQSNGSPQKVAEARAYCINANSQFYVYAGGTCRPGYQLGNGNCRTPDGQFLATTPDDCQKRGGTIALPLPAEVIPSGRIPNYLDRQGGQLRRN